jgi:hypothetical protein
LVGGRDPCRIRDPARQQRALDKDDLVRPLFAIDYRRRTEEALPADVFLAPIAEADADMPAPHVLDQ